MSFLSLTFHCRFFVYAVFKVHLHKCFPAVPELCTSRYVPIPNGDGGIRTLDPLLARQVLSQLSYTPMGFLFIYLGFYPMGLSGPSPMGNTLPDGLKWAFPLWGILYPMGLSGLEPPTSRLSGVRSNQLSYKPFSFWQPPALPHRLQCSTIGRLWLNLRVRDGYGCFP